MRESLIEKANREVSIELVLYHLYGIDVPASAGSWKSPCPLDHDHSDGGKTKAMKVFSESNSAWCFSHSRKFTPVSLWMLHTGKTHQKRAAMELMDFFDISYRKVSPEERWNQMNSEVKLWDRGLIKSTLTNSIKLLVPDYVDRQYDHEVITLMNSLLAEVDELNEDIDYAKLEAWIHSAQERVKDFWREKEWTY